jgi:hypothetical protein
MLLARDKGASNAGCHPGDHPVEPNAFAHLHSTSTSDVNFVTSSNLNLPGGLLAPVTSLNDQPTLGVVCDGKEVERISGLNGEDIRIETE